MPRLAAAASRSQSASGAARPRRLNAQILLIALLSGFLTSGCNRTKTAEVNKNGLTKIRVGYIGLTCEAPIFTAVEKGFFKEEGLDVELVRCQWATYKDVLALGGFDITHHLVMYFLKPIEQGMDVKFTGGIHRGCLRVQAGTKGNIHTIEGPEGQDASACRGWGRRRSCSPTACWAANGIDPSKDVQWRVYPGGRAGAGAGQGAGGCGGGFRADRQPAAGAGKVRNIADQAKDAPYKDEYCCAVLVNGKFLAKNPKAAAAATPALLKAAKWVDANPLAAARLSVEKKYILVEPGAQRAGDFRI